MSWLDDAVNAVADAASDVGGAIVDAAEDVGNAIVDAAEDVGEAIGQAAEDVGEAIGQAAEDVAEWGLNALDDVVFDPVDYLSGGAIDLDYDNGQFTADVDIDLGVADFGLHVGESGWDVSGGFDIGLAEAHFNADDDGNFGLSGSAGVDWGPLPYAEGHITVGEDGTVDIGGRAQATIPTPIGLVGGEVGGSYHQNPDGSWSASGNVEADLTLPDGTHVGAGVHGSYQETADGDNQFNIGVDAEVDVMGVHADAGVDYTRTEVDGSVTNQVDGDISASGYGVNVSAGGSYSNTVDAEGNETTTIVGHAEGSGYGIEGHVAGGYQNVENVDGSGSTTIVGEAGISGYGLGVEGGGSYTETTDSQGNTTSASDSWVDVDGLDTQELMNLGSQALGAATGALSADGGGNPLAMIGDLAGSGDLSDVLGQMGGDGSDPLAAVGNLLDSGQLDDFTSGIVSAEAAETAADQVWDDIGG